MTIVGPLATVMVNETGADVPAELVAVTVNVNGDPTVSVGVPVITPVFVLNVAQAEGKLPPVIANAGAEAGCFLGVAASRAKVNRTWQGAPRRA